MKKNKILFIVFILLLAVFIASNIIIKQKENKQAPLKQTLKDAYITVSAPVFTRNELSEQKAKENFQKYIVSVYFYQADYKKISYTLVFGKYTKEANLENGVQSIINIFKDNNFIYDIKDKNIGKLTGKYIEGTYEKDGVKYGIKEYLIKKDKLFWQVLATFPYSDKNDKAAQDYINSVEISLENK
ncbi:MAG: hypothetical protein FWD54_03640 [Endomicrobia bacterium]|nr:hypothetical protein [Endomicrobiia bacterium]MCL2799350.1 hypothetical protein [Endomicrobiia bacterium]